MKSKFKSRWIISLGLLVVMLLAAVGTVSAAEFPKGPSIPADDVVDDDVFITGQNVLIDGTVNGMLFASGSTVTINGVVNGDALVTGETVKIGDTAVINGNLFVGSAEVVLDGSVLGSVFTGAASVTLGEAASIGRNLYSGSYSLVVADGTAIGTDLLAANYQSRIAGSVARDLRIAAVALDLNGTVGRNAIIEMGETTESNGYADPMMYNPYISRYVNTAIQPGLRVADSASIGGKVVFTGKTDETALFQGIAIGDVVYQTPAPDVVQQPYSGDKMVKPFSDVSPAGLLWKATALGFIRNLIRLFVLGALALWLLSKPFNKLVKAATKEPLKAMGWGFIVLAVGFFATFVVPVAFVMVGVLLGFISLGSLLYVWFGLFGTALLLAFMLFFFAVFTFSKVIAAYMFGKWLMGALFKVEEEKKWLNLLVGVFLYAIIRAIPVLGWVAALAATLIGTGAFWLAFIARKSKK